MMQVPRRAWWSVVTSGTAVAMMLAAGCGGSEPPPAQTGTPSQTQQAPSQVTEKSFAAGGDVELHLDGGSYAVRAGNGNTIRVTLDGNLGAAKVNVTTKDTHGNVSVRETPHNNFRATIEVPQTTDLVIRLAAGDLKVEAIGGNKDVESNAGNVDIVTGDSAQYASVDASVQAGDINAEVFGGSQSGLFRNLAWSGKGKYTLRAKLIAGNLTLRAR
jgi:hypothetical protein